MQKIRKGDTVEVIAGKDRGQRGAVLIVLPKEHRVVVERVNIVKKHQKQQQTGGRTPVAAGIIEFEAPISLSNVMLVCKSCDKRTRVGIRENEEKRLVRYCKQCGQEVS